MLRRSAQPEFDTVPGVSVMSDRDQQRWSVIDPRVLHLGISKLRDMDTAWLRDFAKSDEIVVLRTGDEPISVMVPYEMYQQMQSALRGVSGRRRDYVE